MARTRRLGLTPIFTVPCGEDGKLVFGRETRRACDMWIATLAGKTVDVTIAEHEDTRSAQANAYYWACVMTKAEEANIGYRAEEFHELMLAKFATKKHYEIVDRTGEVVEEYDITQRSSTMKGQPFYRFVEQVRQFLAEFYGVETESPDPAYWEKKPAA